MKNTSKIVQEMRLFSPDGGRLYLNGEERANFLIAAKEESRENRIFCTVLHYTGCRPSEALELTPNAIQLSERAITIRSMKKRKLDNQGKEKLPQYRTIPVPSEVIDHMDLVFDLRKKQLKKTNAIILCGQ